VSLAIGQGAVRDDGDRELRVALGFAILMTGLAPIIANSVSIAHARGTRIRAAGFWTTLFPLITMFPLAFAFEGGDAYFMHYTTYCAWLSGAIGGVGFASVYAQRTRFAARCE